MSWWGKLVGGAFGYMLGGPIGAVLGAALGHRFDKGMQGLPDAREAWDPGDRERIQTVTRADTGKRLFTLPVGLSLMVFFALCAQCCSTLVVMGRELHSILWPIIAFAFMTTIAYLAAWDVRRAKLYGRCEPKVGIAPFERLVEQVMSDEPYRSAPRVFWILDSGTSHRGQRCVERFPCRWPNTVPVHLPKHASWLNQIEIFFSILQRKVLTPADFDSLAKLEDRILRFQEHYQQMAKPFEWRFTRRDLAKLLRKLESRSVQIAA